MEDDAAIQQERDIKFGFHTGRYEPSFFVPFVSPFSRGPSGFLPLTYVLAANAGVVAAAVAAAVAARPTKRRRVASDMSTQPAVAIIAAKRVRRIVASECSLCVVHCVPNLQAFRSRELSTANMQHF